MKSLKLLLLSLVAGLIASTATAEDLTVVSWGGAYTKSQVEAYHKPFEEKTGINIVSADYNGGIAEIKAQVESNTVTWDLLDVELSDAIRACDEGLAELIDVSTLPAGKDGTPASEDFLPGALQDCAVANIVWSTVFAYDDSQFPAGAPRPTTMNDFFDTTNFPGRRGLRRNPKVTLEFALYADGVPLNSIYRALGTTRGVGRAFRKLDTIKDDIVWWEAGAQAPQLLADKEVVMTTAYNGRVFNAVAAEGKPFVVVWDGQIYDYDLWIVVKGAPNKDAALDFLRFSTESEQLAAQASYISYGPARRSSLPFIGQHYIAGIDMAPHMPTAPANFENALQNDYLFWADNADELNERFAAWVNR